AATQTWTAHGYNKTDCTTGISPNLSADIDVVTSSATTHSATSSPTIVAPSTTNTYTVTLTNTTATGGALANKVKVAMPAGFTFVSLTSATTSGNTCSGQANGSWVADGTLFVDGKINLKHSSGATELCPGATVTVVFQATSAATAGTYTWVTEMTRGSIVFVPQGSQPTVVDAQCGNGAVELGEQCDDSNTTNGDGCSSTCTTEPGYNC